jgi:hypothetical protein
MKDIPVPYIRAHQAGVVLFVALAIALRQPQWIYVLAVIQAGTHIFGSVFTSVARPFLKNRVQGAETQSAELNGFNQGLGTLFATLSLIAFSLNLPVVGYVFAVFFGCAALLAILGYCVGCTVYYQIKRFRAKV